MTWMKISLLFLIFHNCGSSTFEDVAKQVGVSGIDGMIAAFGDFNGDKHTDIFVVTGKQGETLSVFLWNNSQRKFTKGRAGLNVGSNNSIVNVAPADFDGDGCMDVLVTIIPVTDKQCGKTHTARVYWGHLQEFETNSTLVSDKLMDQPLIMDANGDLLPDLFGAELPSLSNRTYWISSGKSFSVQFQTGNSSSEGSLAPLRVPHSNAFLDLTGDTTADLLVTTVANDNSKHFEIWKNQDGTLEKMPDSPDLPERISKTIKHMGQSAFADIDGDGRIDHLLPVCSTEDCRESHIYVFIKGEWFRILSNQQQNPLWQFIAPANNCPLVPLMTLRTGDFNLDGYPDALIIVKMKSGDEVPVLLENVQCNEREDIDCVADRTFYLHLKYFESLTNAVVATFFDLHEDGKADFLIVTSSDGTKHIHVLENNFFGDVYFLKVIVLGGRCFDYCSSGQLPFGVNQAGPFVEYITTDTNGKAKRGSAAQLSQSSYYALQCPYTLFGLGATPNFVDYVIVGMPRSKGSPARRGEWPSIIPNSQVIVIPYPPDDPSSWRTILVLTPSKLLLLTGIAMLGICLFIALVILLLHLKEKRADQKAKREDAHKFHFDAM